MLIDGKKIALDIQEKLKQEINALKLKKAPELSVISVGKNHATEIFIRQKKKFGESIGISVTEHTLNKDAATEEIIEKVQNLKDKKGGIIIQLPLPDHIDKIAVLNSVPVSHDVDVLSEESFELYKKDKLKILPPVVGTIKEILLRHNISTKNKNVVIVGKGRLVGKPSAIWFEKHQGNVSVIGRSTKDAQPLLRGADIIVSGAGNPHFITPDMTKDGVVILDAGASESEGKLVGDVDPACAKKASIFTPVPGGIGPVTIAILFRNLLELSKN